MLKFKKGFTLIELLVVIAVMAVVASAVLVLIDPVDKTRAANDSRVQADIGQIATALTAYAAASGGVYPTTAEGLNKLFTAGELTKVPTPPAVIGYGTAYTYTGTATTANVSGTVLSKKYTAASAPGPYKAWAWCNTSATAGAVASLGTCSP